MVITNLSKPSEMKLPPPPEWANDKITEFIEVTKENSYATFVKCKKEFSVLVEIDDLFREATKAAHNCKPYFAFLFILKSHSAFLGAVKLALGTQIPESHMVIRGALENALYGFYIFKNPDLAEVWLRRDESKFSKDRNWSIDGVREHYLYPSTLEAVMQNNGRTNQQHDLARSQLEVIIRSKNGNIDWNRLYNAAR